MEAVTHGSTGVVGPGAAVVNAATRGNAILAFSMAGIEYEAERRDWLWRRARCVAGS